ncbi:hypothetical protein DFS33DRAFT_1249194 [Desarmillaria ectypa]|nr:hypothetical protein DFS33DRAFT_1249194 [Desarmillaria ectypa]
MTLAKGIRRFLGGGRRSTNSHGSEPSIMAARQKVTDTKNEERDADRALSQAKIRSGKLGGGSTVLREVRKSNTKRAKAKQAELKVASKTARALGRHG